MEILCIEDNSAGILSTEQFKSEDTEKMSLFTEIRCVYIYIYQEMKRNVRKSDELTLDRKITLYEYSMLFTYYQMYNTFYNKYIFIYTHIMCVLYISVYIKCVCSMKKSDAKLQCNKQSFSRQKPSRSKTLSPKKS